MPSKFCPKCGNNTNKLYEGLCENCFLKKFTISSELPNKITIALCKECGKFYINERGFENLEQIIESFLKNLKGKKINSITYRIVGNKLFTTLYSKIAGLKKQEEKIIELQQPKITCKFCNMKLSGYFTAILQIRGDVNLDKILKEIENKINKLKQQDNLAFISNVIKKRRGFDIYIGSKAVANKIGKYLKYRYKTKNKISRTLYGKKHGKDMYRDTILVLFGE